MTTPTPGQPLSEADVQNGWIVWSGGEKPPCSGVVHLKFRDGECLTSDAALYDWLHSPRRNAPDDIIAYRPHAPVSRPGDGVEGNECDGCDGGRCVHVGSLCNPPPAEPVSRPAGEEKQTWSQERHDYEAMTAIAAHLRDNPAAPYSGRQCEEFVQFARDALFARPAGEGEREAVARLEELCAGWSSVESAERASAVALVRIADVLRVLSLLRPAAPDAGQVSDCDGCDAGHRCMGVGNVCNPHPRGER